MTLLDQYDAYFQFIAQDHPEVNEVDYALLSIDKAWGDFRSEITEKGYMLRAITYTGSVRDNYADNAIKYNQGGFIVAKYRGMRDDVEEGLVQTFSDAERVMLQIIERMIHDSNAGHPLFYYTINTAQDFRYTPLKHTGDGTYAGWMCIFEFGNFVENCIEDTAWASGGVTPEIL